LEVEIVWPQRPHVLEIHGKDEHQVILVFRSRSPKTTELKAGDDLSAVGWYTKDEIAALDLSPAVIPVLAAHGWL
jgi:hypothetical protein